MIPLERWPAEEGDTLLVPGDLHFPVHHRRAVGLMTEVARRLRPTLAVLVGDTFDVEPLNSHRRDAARALEEGDLASEAESAAGPLAELLSHSEAGVAMQGNHEGRVYRVVDETPGLNRLLEWHTPFAAALRGWNCLPRDHGLQYGPLVVCHGDQLDGMRLGGGKRPASTALGNYPAQYTIFGHTHRVDADTTPSEVNGRRLDRGAWTVGHMSDVRKHRYALAYRKAWQLGFAAVEFHRVGKTLRPVVTQVRVQEDRRGRVSAVFRGEVFRE